MSLNESLTAVLRRPTPANLYHLGGTLRAERLKTAPAAAAALELALQVCASFHAFLSAVSAKSSAEEYNKLASLLDLGSVGTLALQNMLAEPEHRLRRLLMGGLSESLMLIASLQYIKAWEREAQALHEQAAWALYDAFWALSLRGQPDLPAEERRRAVETLLGPALDLTLSAAQRTVYVGWLFQFALMTALAG
jgi:hypothetical protein